MLLSEFTARQGTIYLLSNPVNVAHLLSSIKSAPEGKFIARELIEEQLKQLADFIKEKIT